MISRILSLEAGGKRIVILNESDAKELGIRSSDRVRVLADGHELGAIVNTTSRLIREGELGVFLEVQQHLQLDDGEAVEVTPAGSPPSLLHIRSKLRGRSLAVTELRDIVRDVVDGKLSDIEIASFVVGLHSFGISPEEAYGLSTAMVETGVTLKLGASMIVDKHSIGGVPGDKTTLLVVPIVSACGLTIPKTSSRAITSAAGTADRAEVLMPVKFSVDEMSRIVKRTNGCVVWGGALDLAPADDLFVQVEHPLSIDPLLLPSILSKKKAVNADVVVIDIPCGRGTKVKTIGEAEILARDFMRLGSRLGMRLQCAITFGEQPVGHCVGAALEAREALETIMGRSSVPDLVDKAVDLAGILLEMAGITQNGWDLAMETLKSGKAEKKLREIISEQGGDGKITPENIPIGKESVDIISDNSGYVFWINNNSLVQLARVSGAPKDNGAGIIIHKKIGDTVKEGEKLYTIYAEKGTKLSEAERLARDARVFGVSDRVEMMIEEIKELREEEKAFILER
ncbi:MAG: AMP phosphorylase [archaeon]